MAQKGPTSGVSVSWCECARVDKLPGGFGVTVFGRATLKSLCLLFVRAKILSI
jgi:hypothetical protein